MSKRDKKDFIEFASALTFYGLIFWALVVGGAPGWVALTIILAHGQLVGLKKILKRKR